MILKSINKFATFFNILSIPIAAFFIILLHAISIFVASTLTKTPVPIYAYYATISSIFLGMILFYIEAGIFANNNFENSTENKTNKAIIIFRISGILFWVLPAFIVKPHLISELFFYIWKQL